MSLQFRFLFTLVAAMVAMAPAAYGHHSAIAYDLTEEMQIEGVVTRYLFNNPHAVVVLDVTAADGSVESWKLESTGATALAGVGWDRETFQVGERLKAKINPMKAGRTGGWIQTLQKESGMVYSYTGAPISADYANFDRSAIEGETWQEREAKTRPQTLPLVYAAQEQAGALDPQSLASAVEPPFDLTGTWEFRVERDWENEYGKWEFPPLPDLTPKAQAFYDEYQRQAAAGEGGVSADPTAHCYPPGMPRLMTRVGAFQLMQYPAAIYLVSRFNNEFRAIYLDGRERTAPEKLIETYNGESLGRWEGDELVVETVGFGVPQHLIQAGIPTGAQLRIVERIRVLNDGNTMAIDFTMTDPEHWVGEWTHTKFYDRILNRDIKEIYCLPDVNVQ